MRLAPILLALYLTAAPSPTTAQWTLQDAHTTADLRGIDSLGNGVAWASGSGGTVLRTEDAGSHWQRCTTPPGAETLDFRGIQAFDKDIAIVMSSGKGDLSRLYKTTDACQTWKLVFTNRDKDGFWDAVSFKTTNEGWLLGDPTHGREVLLHLRNPHPSGCNANENCRSDYLVTDQSGPSLDADASMQGSFAASNAAIFVLPDIPCGPLETSTDLAEAPRVAEVWFATGGKAGAAIYRQRLNCGKFYGDPLFVWDKMSVPVGSASESSGVFALTFHDKHLTANYGELRGVAVGGDYLHAEDGSCSAAYSHTGGRNWTASETPPHGYRSAVAYDPTHNTWITVGPNGTDISADDGRNWHSLQPSPAEAPDTAQHWNALSLPFVVGPHGRIGTLRPDALLTSEPPKPQPHP